MIETTLETLVASAAATTRNFEARAYAASSASSPLAPTTIHRRVPGPRDVHGREKFDVTLRVLRGDPESPETVASDGDGTELRFIRVSVNPLLRILTVTLLKR